MPNDLIDQLTQDYRYAKEEVRWVESTEEKNYWEGYKSAISFCIDLLKQAKRSKEE